MIPAQPQLSLPGHECKCIECLRMRGVVIVEPTKLSDDFGFGVGMTVEIDYPPIVVPHAPRNRAERRAAKRR